MPAALPPVAPDDDLQTFTKPEIQQRLRCSERHVDRLIDAGVLRVAGGKRVRGKTVRVTARSFREHIYGADA